MGFTEKLDTRKPRTAAEAYNAWRIGLPNEERNAIDGALADKRWTNGELKPILEGDDDYPAPTYGMTAFREWRAGFLA